MLFVDASSEGSQDDLYKEIIQVKKEELLKEVLQQKQDIEKKRAHRTSQVITVAYAQKIN